MLPTRLLSTSFLHILRAHRPRWNSTVAAQDGPTVSETNRAFFTLYNNFLIGLCLPGAEATMTRFWDSVGIEKHGDVLTVTLDKRTLKTPSGTTLSLPSTKPLLASLIAAEWDHQAKLLKPHALPVTSIASRAIDALTDKNSRTEVQEAVLKYLDSDTICFYQDYPPQLERLQAEHWDPLFAWARKNFDVELNKFDSILNNSQPDDTKSKLRKVLAVFDHWEMAAMERATYTTKSFIIALALVKRHLTVEQASLAATVEVCSQIERWGEVEDTHDVDYHDIRRQLGSAACLLSNA